MTPGSKEAEEYLWNTSLTTLELTHNHGSETDDSFQINNGNVEPHRGFGHLAVMTPDVYAGNYYYYYHHHHHHHHPPHFVLCRLTSSFQLLSLIPISYVMMNITACADLEAAGVPFQKKPDEGRMKGLAFCLSPEGYWIEIIRRSEHAEARAAGLKVNNPYHARIDFTLVNPLLIQYIFHPNQSPTNSIIHILLFSRVPSLYQVFVSTNNVSNE